MIGIVGSAGSGKTVFMTVLVKLLRETVGKQFSAAIRLTTDNPDGMMGVEAYKKNREGRLFEEGDLPPKTNVHAAERRSPIVLQWQREEGGGLRRSRVKSTIMSFVDTAGEDLNTLDRAFTLEYLSVCDGLIVTLDPFSIPGARSRLNLPAAAIATIDGTPFDVLTRITELLRTEMKPKDQKKKIKLPVAVVFTKIDAFYPTLDRGNAIMNRPPRLPVYQESDGQTIHEHVRALLHEWNASDIDLHMAHNYSDFRFFGVSALGAEPDYTRARIADGGVQPHRVEDPMLWLLTKEGTVQSA